MKNDRTPSTLPATPELAPKRRFRIQKLEQRIAPAKGGKYTHKGCSSNTMSTDTSTVGY
jgi:hypothetical protein